MALTLQRIKTWPYTLRINTLRDFEQLLATPVPAALDSHQVHKQLRLLCEEILGEHIPHATPVREMFDRCRARLARPEDAPTQEPADGDEETAA